MTAGTHPRVTRGDSVPPTPPLTAKVVGIPTMEVSFHSFDRLSNRELSDFIMKIDILCYSCLLSDLIILGISELSYS